MKKIIIEIEEPCYEDAINDTEWDTLSLGIYLKELVKNSKPLETEFEEIKAEIETSRSKALTVDKRLGIDTTLGILNKRIKELNNDITK